MHAITPKPSLSVMEETVVTSLAKHTVTVRTRLHSAENVFRRRRGRCIATRSMSSFGRIWREMRGRTAAVVSTMMNADARGCVAANFDTCRRMERSQEAKRRRTSMQ